MTTEVLKKKKSSTVITIIVLALVASSGYYAYFRYQISQIVEPTIIHSGPAAQLNVANWEKVKEGLTKEEVITLVGDSSSKHIVSKDDVSHYHEFWEYNYGAGAFRDSHPRAYVIWFDKDGKVAAFRKPQE